MTPVYLVNKYTVKASLLEGGGHREGGGWPTYIGHHGGWLTW